MKIFKSSLAIGCGLAVILLAPSATHAVQNLLVQVVNTAADPVPNRDVDNQGRHPFFKECASLTQSCFITAPPGQRIVLQYVSAKINADGCSYLNLGVLGVNPQEVFLPCSAAGFGVWVAQGPITFYIEPGSVMTAGTATSGPGDSSERIDFAGYTITP